MNLGEIKRALAKFPSDMDTAEVAMIYTLPNGQRRYEDVLAIGIIPIEDTCAVGLCGQTYIKEQVTAGAMPKPERYDETMAEWDKAITKETHGQ